MFTLLHFILASGMGSKPTLAFFDASLRLGEMPTIEGLLCGTDPANSQKCIANQLASANATSRQMGKR